jgi:transcriptional regulator
MYNFSYFKESDLSVVKEFMRNHPFVLLTGCDANNQPVATHIPLLIEEKEGKLFLYGHVMRQTDHHKAFVANPHVMAVFWGPHTYVSASWYADPQTASTWNYMTVHAKGVVKFLDDAALLDILSRTTAHFENNPQSPSLVEKLQTGYVEKLMKAITAFEIEVTHLDNVFKLSQNRDKESFDRIIPKLKEQGGEPALIAKEMEQRSSQLFKE